MAAVAERSCGTVVEEDENKFSSSLLSVIVYFLVSSFFLEKRNLDCFTYCVCLTVSLFIKKRCNNR